MELQEIYEMLLEEGISEEVAERTCDIISETLRDMIDKKSYGAERQDLLDKYHKNKDKDFKQKVEAGITSPDHVYEPGKSRESKNERGEFKTYEKQTNARIKKKGEVDPYQIYKDPKIAIEKSIKRHALKESVSESTYNDIINMVEEIISELNDDVKVKVGKARIDNVMNAKNATLSAGDEVTKATKSSEKLKALRKMSDLKKGYEAKINKLNKFGKLAGKSIKDPEKRKEFIDYANTNLK